MSDLDLRLDRWSKFSTIIVGIISTGLAAYFLIWFQIPQQENAAADRCIHLLGILADKSKPQSEVQIKTIENELDADCPIDETVKENAFSIAKSIDADRSQIESLEMQIVELQKKLSDQAAEPIEKPRVDGFVSLGIANDYQRSNFRDVKTGEKAVKVVRELNTGAILKARWSVNLRDNNKNTEAGGNRSIRVIRDGECVKLDEKPTEPLRGSWWVNVSLTSCPTE